jgi:hypothetical protein
LIYIVASVGAILLVLIIVIVVIVVLRGRKRSSYEDDSFIRETPDDVPLVNVAVNYNALATGASSQQVISFSQLGELQEIGRGTHGTVYKGRYQTSPVAIKVFFDVDSQEEQKRIFSEYQSMM